MASNPIKIEIKCKYEKLLPIDKLKEFQGGLKSIDLTNLEKLKRSILKHGFSFPIFTWKNNILDGHQRLKAIQSLLDDGHEINELPVISIEAINKKQAAEKLILINSRYAKIEQQGFDVFLTDYDLDLGELVDLAELPEIDFSLESEDSGVENWENRDNFIYKISIDCESEKDQKESIEKIEALGIKCQPLIL